MLEAPTAVLAMLELGGPIIGDTAPTEHDWDDQLQEEAGLDYVELPDGSQVVYDHAPNHGSSFDGRRLFDAARAVVD